MAAEQYKRPYIDTSVFLGWANKETRKGVDRAAVFDHIWKMAQSGVYRLHTSTLTWAEMFKLRHEPNTQPTTTIETILAALEDKVVVPIEVDRDTAISANYLCRIFRIAKLYPNDAVHLACALDAQCDALLCWDRPLSGVVHPSIRIEEPQIIGTIPASLEQETLFKTEGKS